ncbi:hypothetical protein NU195Hw_g5995t1 [Hortaea werneckii]
MLMGIENVDSTPAACVYEEQTSSSRSGIQQSRNGSAGPSSNSTNQSSTADRLASLEERLETFGSQLGRIEQCLSVIAGRAQSVPPTDAAPSTGGGLQRQANVRASSSPAPEQSESLQSQNLDVSDEIVAALVDTFFGCCHNQPYSFFHEGAFRQHLAEKAIPMHLILAVMASAPGNHDTDQRGSK